MFKTPVAQWEVILTKPLKSQISFLKKVCKVNRKDELVIREAFFNNLSYPLVKKIFKLVADVIETDAIDPSFQEVIYDRLLRVIGIARLYPVDRDAEDNIIEGENYEVYSACYHDLEHIVDFINHQTDINSICDLGSGSGRALLYMALQVNRKIEYMGLELVDNRVEFTNSISKYFNLQNLSFKTSDFLETPEDFHGFGAYYLYDPVGTEDVPVLVSYFVQMIASGASFYILFLSGWDDLMLNALDNLDSLEKIESRKSHKQQDRYLNFYKVIDRSLIK
jgi:hypothetical protein